MFKNDYSEGAHPKVLELLQKTNLTQQEAYGLDEYSMQAAALIRDLINMPQADVHFFTGGTQTNLTLISAALRPHEAVLSAHSAHINVHETGAIEATGHKIFQLPGSDGKITTDDLQQAIDFHQDEHYVKPRLVFISNATELGTVYTSRELEQLYDFCQNHGLYLYLDGARLGNAIEATNDLNLKQVAQFTDAFYIGGTKNGALLGEALVITNPNLKRDFRYIMKQRGALIAKGRVVGIQFLALLQDGLYFELAKRANNLAQQIRQAIEQSGFSFLADSPTNQIFPILPDDLIQQLYTRFDFYIWQRYSRDSSVIRLVTSWATDETKVGELIKMIRNYSKQK